MTPKALKLVCLGILVLLLGIPSLAQNTKGDKPAPAARESRFKTPKKTKQKKANAKRIRAGSDRAGQPTAPPQRRQRGERPGKPITPQFSKSRPSEGEKPWRGDLTRRRIRPRSSSSQARNVYPQPATMNYSSRSLRQTLRENKNPNVRRVQKMQREESDKPKVGKPIRPTFHKTRPQHSEQAWRGDITGRKIRAGAQRTRPPTPVRPARIFGSSTTPANRRNALVRPRISGRARNVYGSNSFYVNNGRTRRSQSDRTRVALTLLKRYNSRKKPGESGRSVTPRSASAAYMARRSTNTWAHFPRPKRRGERAITTDLAGHKLRGKNYQTQRPILTNPTLNYQRRSAIGERPYKGPAAGGYISRTRSGRAWNGDIAHRAIRGGFRSKKGEPTPGAPLFGRGPGRGAERVGRYQGNIRTGRRGFGNQGEEYTGNIKAHRPDKGGGTRSGSWNNNGRAILGRTPGKGSDRIGYSGNIRGGKKIFNDQGEEYSGNIKAGRRGFNDQGEEYTGNIKAGKRGFNDQGEEYSGNIRAGRRGFSDQGEEYSGNIKAHRPDKGGGTRSGSWNNNNSPIQGRTPRGKSTAIARYQGNLKAGRKAFEDQGEEYSGNIKARRPDKGGGSVSGKVWNNDERAIEGKAYVGQTRLSRYSGNLKARRPEKGGGSVSGKLWNNEERPIDGKAYTGLTKLSRYSGNVKAKRPEKGGGEEGDFSGNVKVSRNDYKRNPNSAPGAMPGLKASAASVKAGQHTRGVRRDWDYIKNPSSADAAQRTREPGRAFGRSADYHGNIRLKKFDLFGKSDLHPDARFVKLNKNNVDEERDMLTNFKLWWSRLFRKEETQPDHLKEKDRKPRYDKGEAGLWYE